MKLDVFIMKCSLLIFKLNIQKNKCFGWLNFNTKQQLFFLFFFFNMETGYIVRSNIINVIKQYTEQNIKQNTSSRMRITNNPKIITIIQSQIQQFIQNRSNDPILSLIYLEPVTINNIHYQQIYRVSIKGRLNTHYQFRKIICYLFFPDGYPMDAPFVYFQNLLGTNNKQKIFEHINIFESGRLCQQILTSLYKANVSLTQILQTIQKTIYEDNPKSPANSQFVKLKQKNIQEYNKKLRQQSKLLQLIDQDQYD